MLDALLRTRPNRLVRASPPALNHDLTDHETEEDRDAQDRASRPSAFAARRPAQATSRPERPEDRAARRNELRRADRMSPEAPEHGYNGKRPKGDAFDHAKGSVKAADILLDWRVERIVLLGKNVARCFGFRDLPFLAEISIYGRRFLIFPHPSGTNRWWNERQNERRARQLLQRFLRGETVPAKFRKNGRSTRTPSQIRSTGTSANSSRGTISRSKVSRTSP